ncbi:MAG: phage major capsid protein [Pseudomonadota bacterium]
MIDAMSKSVTFGFDEAFIRGTGVGQPLGILNAPATISVAKESGQAADTIVFENIVNMWSRLAPSLVNDAIWIVNPEALPQLLTMSFPTGAANGTPLFLPSQAIADKHAGSIFGRPLFFSEKASAIGDQGDLILVAPSQYIIGLRLDAAFARSNAPGFMSDVENFRLVTRAEGLPAMNSAITPRYGTNTLSYACVLDDRA